LSTRKCSLCGTGRTLPPIQIRHTGAAKEGNPPVGPRPRAKQARELFDTGVLLDHLHAGSDLSALRLGSRQSFWWMWELPACETDKQERKRNKKLEQKANLKLAKTKILNLPYSLIDNVHTYNE
jgi:hypothetical protein